MSFQIVRLPIMPNLRIASPCNVVWEEMIGDDRVRSCRRCDKQVFDISSLTRREVEALLLAHGEAPCVRYYQRADGTILLADCTYHEARGGWLPAVAIALGCGAAVVATPPHHDAPRPDFPVAVAGGTGPMAKVITISDTGELSYRGEIVGWVDEVAGDPDRLFAVFEVDPRMVRGPDGELPLDGRIVIVDAPASTDARVINAIIGVARQTGYQPLLHERRDVAGFHGESSG